jgi:hypothetical protein
LPDQLRTLCSLIVLIKGGQLRRDPIVPAKIPRVFHRFSGNQVNLLQDPQGPQRDVFQIPERRGDNEESPRVPMLIIIRRQASESPSFSLPQQ